MTEIHLLHRIYTLRQTEAGTLVVFVGRWLWRVASAADSERVLAGLQLRIVR